MTQVNTRAPLEPFEGEYSSPNQQSDPATDSREDDPMLRRNEISESNIGEHCTDIKENNDKDIEGNNDNDIKGNNDNDTQGASSDIDSEEDQCSETGEEKYMAGLAGPTQGTLEYPCSSKEANSPDGSGRLDGWMPVTPLIGHHCQPPATSTACSTPLLDVKSFIPVQSTSPPVDSDNTSLFIPMCRICHMPEDDSNLEKLTSPCRCAGTLQYIHNSCLKKWLEITSKKSRKPPKCELCHYQYHRHKKFKFHHWRLPRVSKQDKILHLVFLINILIMIGCAIATVMCFLSDKGQINKFPRNKSNEQLGAFPVRRGTKLKGQRSQAKELNEEPEEPRSGARGARLRSQRAERAARSLPSKKRN
ncbi:unnamed protein product [Owenia fusiformis]|uniref:RING-CH-type domain-containing protein n=1 Tax=Owenia fusiformis TaxID=6347 RepID=A0A8S4N490_OWEFU|nr:unnamed protein product [Owenia fusiformis]